MARSIASAMREPHIVGPAAAIVIVLAIGIYSYIDGEAFKAAETWAQQSRALVNRTQELLSLLKDAESSQRGFLLTGDAQYLNPYQEASPKIEEARKKLAASGAADEAAALRLSDLVRERMEVMDRTIRLRERGMQGSLE